MSLPFPFSRPPRSTTAPARIRSTRTSVFLCTLVCITALQKCLSPLLDLAKCFKFSVDSLIDIFFGLLGFTSGCLGNQHEILDQFQWTFHWTSWEVPGEITVYGPNCPYNHLEPYVQVLSTCVSTAAEHLATPGGFVLIVPAWLRVPVRSQ